MGHRRQNLPATGGLSEATVAIGGWLPPQSTSTAIKDGTSPISSQSAALAPTQRTPRPQPTPFAIFAAGSRSHDQALDISANFRRPSGLSLRRQPLPAAIAHPRQYGPDERIGHRGRRHPVCRHRDEAPRQGPEKGPDTGFARLSDQSLC